MFSYALLGTATNNNANNTSSLISSVIMIVILLAIFYFFLYRPQKKQEKEKKNMLDALSIGDEITTIGGIIGKIVGIKDETVLIETSHDRTKIRVLRTSISRVDVKAEDAEK